MKFKKNDMVTVEIKDMGHDGEGIGKAEGYTLFIKDAVIGDLVEAKVMKAGKNYGYARLMQVLKPSKDRVEPKCSCARACGGCQLQALSYEKQLEFKEKKVRGNLERIGGFSDLEIEKVIGMEHPWRYRNKAQYPVGKDKDGKIITGFYAGRTHSIIPNQDCLLGAEILGLALQGCIVCMRAPRTCIFIAAAGCSSSVMGGCCGAGEHREVLARPYPGGLSSPLPPLLLS